jgi:hypothetical protein
MHLRSYKSIFILVSTIFSKPFLALSLSILRETTYKFIPAGFDTCADSPV